MNEAGVAMDKTQDTVNMPDKDNAQDQLDWLAFRYAANELSSLERVSFEGQLATDQAAREAVARVVQRTTEMSQALTEEAFAPRLAASQRAWVKDAARWTTVGLGSCLALLFALLASRPGTFSSLDSSLAPQAAVESLDLAYAWAEARSPQDDFSQLLSELPVFNDAPVAEADRSDEADQMLGPPSWMIAAVARMDQSPEDNMGLQE